MIKRVGKLLVALLFSLFIIPLIAAVTLTGYENVINSIGNNLIVLIAYSFIAILIVLFVISLLIKLINDKLEVPLIYHIVIGMLTLFILVWLILYSKTQASTICDIAKFGRAPTLCVKYLNNEKLYFIYAIYSVACYGMYIVLSIMKKKKKH